MRKLVQKFVEKKETIKDSVTIAKESFITVREVTILLILTLFLTSVDFEGYLMKKLNHAGITEVMGVKLKTQQQIAVETAKMSSEKVSELEGQVNELVGIINTIKSKIPNKEASISGSPAIAPLGENSSPGITSNIIPPSAIFAPEIVKKDNTKEINKQVEKIQKTIDEAKNITSNNLVNQQITLSAMDPNVEIPLTGWIYLGKLNASKTDWDDGLPNSVNKIAFQDLKVGMTLKTVKTVNLRSQPYRAPDEKSDSKILSAINSDEELRVDEIKFSVANSDGSPTCWVKIHRLNIKSIINEKKTP